MSDYIKRQVEERNRAWEYAKQLVETAAAESRDLTAEEETAYAAAVADVDKRGQVINDMLANEKRDAEIREATAGRVEARADERVAAAPVADDAEVLRKIARGEIRSHSFEQRTATKSSTGAPVPTSFYDQVQLLLRYVGPMFDVSTILETSSGENLQIPRTSAYSTGSVTTEGSTMGVSDPTFQSFLTLGAFKETVYFQVSSELLADSGVDILGYIATNVGQGLGYIANNHLTVGTGTTQPTGVVPSAGSGVTGATALSGVARYSDLVDLVYSTDAAVRRMPGFALMGSTTAIAGARKLVDTTGQPIWTPGAVAGQPDTILGYRVVENPHMAATATSAKSWLAGDFKSFLIRQVGGLRLDRSDEFAFSSDLVTFRATLRIDSGLPQSNAIKYYIGNAA